MEEQREKCSGEPERKKGKFPYRPKDAPRPAPVADVPGPDDPRFATIRPFFMQRKDDAALRRQAQIEAHRRQVEAIADTKIRRALEREEAERQRGIDEFWHALDRKVRPEPRRDQGGPANDADIARGPRPARSPFQLAAYPCSIVDRRGRVGVFMSSTYLAAKTTEYGCMRRLSYYFTKPDHLENEESFFSNMGEDRHEIACGMALIEDANRAARANAKVAITHIVQLPHDVSPAERMTILRLWCDEHLGVHDLPFVAAVHKPSPDGDRRNYHGHVVSSFRPAYRPGRYAWRIGLAPRTDLDNPATFDEYRRDFATLMTAVVQIAGHDRIYTHLSHAGRGLKHKPTEKLGPQKTRQVRDGEDVAANARNARTIATNVALAEIDRIDERATRNRRRMARLAALKNLSARALSPIAALPKPERTADPRTLARSRSLKLPVMTTDPLAAAFRLTGSARAPASSGTDDAPTLIDTATLQAAASLDDAPRLSLIDIPQMPFAGALRNLSRPIDVPVVVARSVRLPAQVEAIERNIATARLPSTVGAPDRRVVIARRFRVMPLAGPSRTDVRTLSTIPTIRPVVVQAHALSDQSVVAPTSARSKLPSRIEAPGPPSAVPLRSVSKVGAPVRKPLAPRELAPIATPEPIARTPIYALSRAVRVPPPTIRTKRLSDVNTVEMRQHDPALVRRIDGARLARLGKRAEEAEREARATTAVETVDREQREYRRHLRFLALIVLHPDWLADGPQGVEMAAHTPPEMQAAFADWRNDHSRRQMIAAVRQATLEGMHTLPPDLVRDIERTVMGLASRLPPPPPLRDNNGRLSVAGEVMLALAADASPRAPIPGDPSLLSPDASPALRTMVARHAGDPHLSALLATALRHSAGAAGAVEIGVARRIDQRRMGWGLRRKAGPVPVLTPAGDRLSSAMVDHLARARLHPEWIDHAPHLGMAPGERASRLFRDQWSGWADSRLARRLLIENAGTPAQGRLLTHAMRAQVTARVQTIAGEGGSIGTAGVAPTIDRSR